MNNYHDLNLKCDVLLLVDMFGKFRNNSLKNYGLCPNHYLSTPVLNQDAMLNMTEVELELIPDSNMFIFFEKGMRGGVCYISNRYSKAHNKYLKYYDPKQEAKHITYLNANNLYGYAISKFLPTSGFKWIDRKQFYLNKYTSNSLKECVLEVNLEYPKKLHELRNDYPLVPDKIEIKREMLSNYQIKITDFYNITIDNAKKLVPNFFDKEKYALHYENLELYLRLGLKLKTINCVLEFNESQQLKPFDKFNTHKRIETEKNGDEDGKAWYKLMNNAVYGKAIENLRNRIDVKLVSNKKHYLKQTPKPSYMSQKIFYNNLIAIHKTKLY